MASATSSTTVSGAASSAGALTVCGSSNLGIWMIGMNPSSGGSISGGSTALGGRLRNAGRSASSSVSGVTVSGELNSRAAMSAGEGCGAG